MGMRGLVIFIRTGDTTIHPATMLLRLIDTTNTPGALGRRRDAQGVERYPARGWIVERTLTWLSKCRAILVPNKKKASNYTGLFQLACVLLWHRRQWQLKF